LPAIPKPAEHIRNGSRGGGCVCRDVWVVFIERDFGVIEFIDALLADGDRAIMFFAIVFGIGFTIEMIVGAFRKKP
jgi:hypothetical protein